MSVLIVGGDYVTSFKHLISTQNYARVEHWNGRKKGFLKREIPQKTQLVIVICDFVNHSLANAVKEKANRDVIPLMFCTLITRLLRQTDYRSSEMLMIRH